MNKYAVLKELEVVNIIAWDGETPYAVEPGLTLLPITDDMVFEIGDRLVKEVTVIEETPQEKSFWQKLAFWS